MKHLITFVLALSLVVPAIAQVEVRERFFDGGVLLGITNYSGDVAERRIDIQETQPGYGFYLRYHFNRNFALKAHVYSGSISGDDRHSPEKKDRSFKFGTSIFETALVGEWSPVSKNRFSRTGLHKSRITPYFFAGLGCTFANSNAEYYGPSDRRNDYLRVPLPEDNLQRIFLLAPMGGGIQFDVSEYIRMGGEFGIRPVFSDDLDGIKINGNPNSGDWYYFGGITMSVILSSQ
jgi:OmpA-OmpF porin, OOP family